MRARHVLVVNGGKEAPYRRLRSRWPDLDLTVLTEMQHRDLYTDLENVWVVDDLTDLESVRFQTLAIIGARGRIDAVVAPSERTLPVGGFIRSFLGLPGYGFDESMACTNKFAMKERLRRWGVPVVESRLAVTPAEVVAAVESMGCRAVVKPAFGIGSSFTYAVDPGTPELHEAAERVTRAAGPCVVEEYFDVVDELHCDGVTHRGSAVFASVSQYFGPVLRTRGKLQGSFTVRPGEKYEAMVRDLHDRSVQALGPRDGVTHLEVLVNSEGEAVVGEMACRPGGGGVPAVLRHVFGIDTMDLFIDANLGIAPTVGASHNDRVAAWCQIPVSAGTITHMMSAQDLREIDGVVDVDLTAAVGDTFTEPVYSTTNAGMVLIDVPDRRSLRKTLTTLKNRCSITIRPHGEEPLA